MKSNNLTFRAFIFAGIIIIALGIILNTSESEASGSMGPVLTAVGTLFLIIGMSKKRKTDSKQNE